MAVKICWATVYSAGLLLLAAALLYLLTLDNGLRADELSGGDLITHQYAQVQGRPSNAPGYPLYTMGGWLWFRLGRILLGWALNPIQILSLYSTGWGLASLLILYLILLRVTAQQRLITLLLTAFYAVTYFFWYYSVTTEQYTSAVFQTLLAIWLALRWDEQPRPSTLLWLAFLTGTMLANMVTTLFILPPLLWFIFSPPLRQGSSISFKARPVLLAFGLACLPLLSYAYIFLSGALHPEWRGSGEWPDAWAWFIDFLTISQGRNELAPGLSLHNFFTAEFPALMARELTWPVFLGGLIGLAFLGKRRAIFLYSTLVIYFVFCWFYRFGNWFQVIIPAYPIFIIGCAAGLSRMPGVRGQGSGIRGQGSGYRLQVAGEQYAIRNTQYAFIIGLLTILVLYRFTTNLPRADQSHLPTDTGLDPGWAILADRPTSPALVSADFPEQVALQYLSTIWGAGSGIYSTTPGDFTPPAGQTDSLSYYISRQAIAADPTAIPLERMYPQAAGVQLIALRPESQTELPPDTMPLDLRFGDSLKLSGWEHINNTYPLPNDVAARLSPANWQIALYWQTSQGLNEDYTISIRPLVGGQEITNAGEALIQDHQPVWGVYPTSRWQPNEIVRDVYALRLPEGVTPEAVQVVVYKTSGSEFENIAVQMFALH